MVDAWHDVERTERFYAADAEHELLADAGAHVAAVEARSKLAILRAVAIDVAIEQVERNAANVHEPDLGLEHAIAGVDRDRDWIAVGTLGGFHRQVLDPGIEVLFLLIAIAIKLLLEIALVVEEPNGNKWDGEAARALNVIAREDTEAARIDRHGFVDAELGRKIGDGLGAKDAAFAGAPGVKRVVEIFLEPTMGLVDAGVEHHLGGPLGELVGRH